MGQNYDTIYLMVKIQRQYVRRYILPDGTETLTDGRLKYGVVWPKGGLTVVKIKIGDIILSTGVARCSDKDSFVKKYGYSLAFRRAYEQLQGCAVGEDEATNIASALLSIAASRLQQEYQGCVAFLTEVAVRQQAQKPNEETEKGDPQEILYQRHQPATYATTPIFVDGERADGVVTFKTNSDAAWNHNE